MELLFIFVAFALYKIYSISKSEIPEEYTVENPELNIEYKNNKISKKKVSSKKNVQKNLEFEMLSKWLENPSQNRNYYSLSIIHTILFSKTESVTEIALHIQKDLLSKKLQITVEKIYENIGRLWNNDELNKNYIFIDKNNFIFSVDISEKEFVTLNTLFQKALKEESNYSWNAYRVTKDLNYLFDIIPRSNSNEFI